MKIEKKKKKKHSSGALINTKYLLFITELPISLLTTMNTNYTIIKPEHSFNCLAPHNSASGCLFIINFQFKTLVATFRQHHIILH